MIDLTLPADEYDDDVIDRVCVQVLLIIVFEGEFGAISQGIDQSLIDYCLNSDSSEE